MDDGSACSEDASPLADRNAIVVIETANDGALRKLGRSLRPNLWRPALLKKDRT
jgi:hypothetical protein